MLTHTTTALLDRLRDRHEDRVWIDFDRRYRPIVIRFGRRMGLSEADAADAAQDTLLAFVTACREGRYDRERGRLRSFLFGIARFRVLRLLESRRDWRGDSALGVVPDPDALITAWNGACERSVVRLALCRLRTETRCEPRTIEAFEAVVLHGRGPEVVAAEFGMSVNDVYLAKHRCLRRLRSIVEQVRDGFEHLEDEGAMS